MKLHVKITCFGKFANKTCGNLCCLGKFAYNETGSNNCYHQIHTVRSVIHIPEPALSDRLFKILIEHQFDV